MKITEYNKQPIVEKLFVEAEVWFTQENRHMLTSTNRFQLNQTRFFNAKKKMDISFRAIWPRLMLNLIHTHTHTRLSVLSLFFRPFPLIRLNLRFILLCLLCNSNSCHFVCTTEHSKTERPTKKESCWRRS